MQAQWPVPDHKAHKLCQCILRIYIHKYILQHYTICLGLLKILGQIPAGTTHWIAGDSCARQGCLRGYKEHCLPIPPLILAHPRRHI